MTSSTAGLHPPQKSLKIQHPKDIGFVFPGPQLEFSELDRVMSCICLKEGWVHGVAIRNWLMGGRCA